MDDKLGKVHNELMPLFYLPSLMNSYVPRKPLAVSPSLFESNVRMSVLCLDIRR